ncbi:MAG: hypothetical protein Kow00108_04060 [Calditrichia bacterium]
MSLRKFFIILGIHVFILIAMTLIIIAFVRNDVINEFKKNAEYEGISVSIEQPRNGLPYIETNSTKGIAWGLGYLHGFNRTVQLQVLYHLTKGQMVFQQNDTSYMKTDQLISSLHLDSLVNEISSRLSEETKIILNAYLNGLNEAIEERKKNDDLPFLVYSFKEPHLRWTEDDIIRVMAFQMVFGGPTPMVHLDELLMEPALSDFFPHLSQFRDELNRLFYSKLSLQFFPVINHFGGNHEFLIYERNILPSVMFPVNLELRDNQYRLITQPGNFLTYYKSDLVSNHSFMLDANPISFSYNFHTQKENLKIHQKTISVKDPKGTTRYLLVPFIENQPVIAGDKRLRISLMMPPGTVFANYIDQITKWSYSFSSFSENDVPYILSSQNMTRFIPSPYFYMIDKKKVEIKNQMIGLQLELIQQLSESNFSLSQFQDSLFSIIKHFIPKSINNDTLQSLSQMLLFETDIKNSYSILPTLWLKLMHQFNSQQNLIQFRSGFAFPYYVYLYLPDTSRINEKNLNLGIQELLRDKGDMYSNWQWGKMHNSTFHYIVPEPSITSYFKMNKLKTNPTFGLHPNGLIPTEDSSVFWYVTTAIISDSLIFRNPVNDQINSKGYWDFNRE